MRVNTISELFNLASVLSKQPKPKGSKLSIVTNAGGPSVLATDAAITHGASLSQLSDETILEMNQFLPAAWSHGNPVDILGDADTERYVKTMQTLSLKILVGNSKAHFDESFPNGPPASAYPGRSSLRRSRQC